MGKNSYALVTGLFLVILMTVTVIIIIWLGGFQTRTNVYVVATRNSVTGLKPGSTVYYRGIAVGKVSAVAFDPDDPEVIIVPINISKEIKLTRGVYATLNLKGVTGLTQVALQDSGSNPEFLPAGTKLSDRIFIQPSLIDRISDSGEEILQQTRELMTRLNRILSDENEQHIQKILGNVKTATSQFITLQETADKTLKGLPALTADIRRSLAHVDDLTIDFKDVTQQLKIIAPRIEELVKSGTAASNIIVETTLPRANVLLVELQSTTRRFKHVATLLENNPQAFLLGRDRTEPGPGELGFEEPK